jgi:hypothetical protein
VNKKRRGSVLQFANAAPPAKSGGEVPFSSMRDIDEDDKEGSVSDMSASVDEATKAERHMSRGDGKGREGMTLDTANRALMLELLASMSPELSFDDTTEHIIRLTREFFGVDRVGFFLADLERGFLLLRVSEEGRYSIFSMYFHPATCRDPGVKLFRQERKD